MKRLLNSRYLHHYTAGAVAFLTCFAYWRTLAPTIGFIDSGELATVPAVLGIAHPTGYPLFTILGRIFSILPLASGEILRLNLMSALLTAGATVFAYYALLELLNFDERLLTKSASTTIAASASLILAFSRTFWDQSAAIEVYSLHLLLVTCSLWLFIVAAWKTSLPPETTQRYWLLFAFIVGLGFTNHMTIVLLAPALLYAYFQKFGFSRRTWRHIAILSIPFLLGLSVYLYLPIRAASDPPLNWGHPTTIERILWHLGGKQYRVWMFSGSDVMVKQFNVFTTSLTQEFFFVPLLLALLGVWRLLLHNRRTFLFLFLLLVGCVLYAINYSINDINSYFLLAYITITGFACFGMLELWTWIKKPALRLALNCCFVIIPVMQWWTNNDAVDKRDLYLVEDYTYNMLHSLQPNSIILSFQWDHFVAGAYYFQQIQKIRRDVIVIDKELLRRSWYFEQIRNNAPEIYKRSQVEIEQFLPELHKFEHDLPYNPNVIEERYNAMINSIIDHNIDQRPVYVGPEIEAHLGASYTRVPEGLAYRLYADTIYHSYEFPQFRYRPFSKKDLYTGQLHNFYAAMLTRRGTYEIQNGYPDRATPYFQKAYELNPNVRTQQFLRNQP